MYYAVLLDNGQKKIYHVYREIICIKPRILSFKKFKIWSMANDWLKHIHVCNGMQIWYCKGSIFTDSGKGWHPLMINIVDHTGRTIKFKDHKYENDYIILKEDRSNNFGELYALFLALTFCKHHTYVKRIYTDSWIVAHFWIFGHHNTLPLSTKHVILKTINLFNDFIKRKGKIILIKSQDNLADLGFHHFKNPLKSLFERYQNYITYYKSIDKTDLTKMLKKIFKLWNINLYVQKKNTIWKKYFIYNCGPTVYNNIHIGNLWSILVAYFHAYHTYLYEKKKVYFIQNYTDIDEKILYESFKNKVNFRTLSNKFIQRCNNIFIKFNIKNCRNLIIKKPWTTESIKTIFKILTTLSNDDKILCKYDGIYLKKYTKEYSFILWKYLSSLKLKSIPAQDIQKFNLYLDKQSFWKDPITGNIGIPGWHIECVAMSSKFTHHVDIKCGGEDLKFPHHHNELLILKELYASKNKCIDQRYLHTGLLKIKDAKMSKSSNNIILVKDLLIQFDANIIKLYLLSYKHNSHISFCKVQLKYINDLWHTFKAKLSIIKWLFYNIRWYITIKFNQYMKVEDKDQELHFKYWWILLFCTLVQNDIKSNDTFLIFSKHKFIRIKKINNIDLNDIIYWFKIISNPYIKVYWSNIIIDILSFLSWRNKLNLIIKQLWSIQHDIRLNHLKILQLFLYVDALIWFDEDVWLKFKLI